LVPGYGNDGFDAQTQLKGHVVGEGWCFEVLKGPLKKEKNMATKAATRPRKDARSGRKDLHVKIADRLPSGPEAGPGEGGRYVYGIVEAKEQTTFGKIGIGGAGEMVYMVKYLDIAAAVSKTAVYIFDPTRENALAHEHVIETVMKNYTIIPM